MGFRCTFTTYDFPVPWPDWFREKYKHTVHVPDRGCLSAKFECKNYGRWIDLEEDVRKAIDWEEWSRIFVRKGGFVITYLFECGGISRSHIYPDEVRYSEPSGWFSEDDSTHGYHCADCGRPDERQF